MPRPMLSSMPSSPSRSRGAALRLLTFLDPPDHHHPPLELDESDVVWSSTTTTSTSAHSSDTDSHSPPPSSSAAAAAISPTSHVRRNHRTHLSPGLSAALSEDPHLPPLVRRKSSLSASRMVPRGMRSESPLSIPKSAAARYPKSAPVNVPAWPAEKKNAGGFGGSFLQQLDEEEKGFDEEEEEEMVPPHVIVARSHVTFSVFEGVGRTLKGRDLRRVRNAVFQQTGFLD